MAPRNSVKAASTGKTYAHSQVLMPKSAESLENKRIEFLGEE